VDVGALIFNWSCLTITVVALGVSLTVARCRRWARPASQWFLASCVVGTGVNLINLYTRAHWAPYLFWLVGPLLIASVVTAILESVRSHRHGHPSSAGK
jgi:hypothetical protein